jgi:exodeoxyribonuclease V gamma subunit
LPAGADESLRLSDWLGDLREGPGGERCRLLLHSGGLVRNRAYRYDKLVPFWVAHLAAHLDGPPLRTLVISKAGSVEFRPLDTERARARWADLLDAWQQGLASPLPLALRSGFAWLEESDVAGAEPTASDEAREAARSCYELHEPERGRLGERDTNAYLARAFPSFESLWSAGRFAHWATRLLLPLVAAVARASNGRSGGEA